MGESINDRMELLANQYFSGNKSAFAKAIGLSSTGLGSYIGGVRRSQPSVKMVGNILRALPQISPRWLITGEGEMETAKEYAANLTAVAGDYSAAAVNGDAHAAPPDAALLQAGQKIKAAQARAAALEQRLQDLRQLLKDKDQILSEKERLIQVLLKQLETLPQG